MTNLVHHENTTLTVHGTDGDDVFLLDPSQNIEVSINGTPYTFQPNAVRLAMFDGGMGFDKASLDDTPGDDTVRTYPGSAILTSSDLTVRISNVSNVYAYARSGGEDTISMHDSPQSDKLKIEPQYHTVKLLRHPFFMNRAKFFETVVADSSQGTDSIRLWDTVENDHVSVSPTELHFVSEAAGWDVKAHEFDHLIAWSTAGGHDTAQITDSPQNDVFHMKPNKVTVDYDYQASNYRADVTLRQFEHTTLEAVNGGYDKAKIWPTSRDDFIEAEADWLRFSQSNGIEQEALFDILAFDFVKLRTTDSDRDQVSITHPLDFDLLLADGWQEVENL